MNGNMDGTKVCTVDGTADGTAGGMPDGGPGVYTTKSRLIPTYKSHINTNSWSILINTIDDGYAI